MCGVLSARHSSLGGGPARSSPSSAQASSTTGTEQASHWGWPWRKRQCWFNRSSFNVFFFLLQFLACCHGRFDRAGSTASLQSAEDKSSALFSSRVSAGRRMLQRVWAMHQSHRSLWYWRRSQRDSARGHSLHSVAKLWSCDQTQEVLCAGRKEG